MRFFDAFAGVGGFHLGIEQAYSGLESDGQADVRISGRQETLNSTGTHIPLRERPDGHAIDSSRPTCVGYSEIDKYAIKVYERNFPDAKNYGDITKINTAELPDFDLLVGGFPCQAFSVAGKRAGFNDTRGTLIFDVVRILRDKRPRYFVLENVKGLLSHDSGKTFSHILEILTDSGYDVSWSIHNSKNYGVPQNRERIYFIGSLRGERRPQVFPLSEPDGLHTKARTTKEKVHDIASTQTARQYASWGGNFVTRQPLRFLDRNQKNIKGDYAFTVDASQTSGVRIDAKIRRLTPTECLRLQGFPDDWFEGAEVNSKPISDSQRYKCCGNAVTVNVVEHVVSEMFNPTQS